MKTLLAVTLRVAVPALSETACASTRTRPSPANAAAAPRPAPGRGSTASTRARGSIASTASVNPPSLAPTSTTRPWSMRIGGSRSARSRGRARSGGSARAASPRGRARRRSRARLAGQIEARRARELGEPPEPWSRIAHPRACYPAPVTSVAFRVRHRAHRRPCDLRAPAARGGRAQEDLAASWFPLHYEPRGALEALPGAALELVAARLGPRAPAADAPTRATATRCSFTRRPPRCCPSG